MCRQRFIQAALLFLLVVAGVVPASAVAQAPSVALKKNILLMYSYGYGAKGVQLFTNGLVSGLSEQGVRVNDLYFEFLDLERNKYHPQYREELARFLTQKYAGRRIDLIVTVQQPALGLLLNEGDEFLKGVPAISVQAPVPRETGTRRIVSVLTRFDMKGTLERAYELFPNAKQLVVVSGEGDDDKRFAFQAETINASLGGKIPVRHLRGMSYEAMLAAAASTSPQTIILFTQYNRDAQGRAFLGFEVAEELSRVANAPVFAMQDTFLGSGIIGGSLVRLNELGNSAANLAVNMLKDRDGSTFPVISTEEHASPLFDWKQIVRWQGDISKLPANASFLNRPPDMWEEHKYVIFIFLAVLLMLTGMVAALMFQNRHRKIAELSARESEGRVRVLVDHAPEAILVLDANKDRFVDANGKAEVLLERSRSSLLDSGSELLFDAIPSEPNGSGRRLATLREAFSGNEVMFEQILSPGQDNEKYCEVRVVPLPSAQGEMLRISINDITERKRSEQKIHYLAYHDTLTSLPNRQQMRDRFSAATAPASRADAHQAKIAIIFLDLDNFKTINDSLGHLLGDELLCAVARRLEKGLREGDTMGRLGGDEFLIILEGLADAESAVVFIERMIETIGIPFDLEGNELATTASVGVAMYPDHASDFDSLLKKADMAMYQAKNAGRNTFRFFTEQMDGQAASNLFLKNGLRKAIQNGEFQLHFQPQIALSTGAIVGVEALIRWVHPELGIIAPAAFIPVAEDSGLIGIIGEWVLRETCRQAVMWRNQGLPDLIMAVNLSALQFRRGNLEETLLSVLRETTHRADLLELEITESVLIQNVDNVMATVKRLKLLGLRIAIDDFGTGYSSLSYLKRLDVDKLKIDQSFIKNIATDEDDAAIVKAVIQMAHSLGVATVAEGVEDDASLRRLREFGCDEGQGYLFARPMPAEAFTHFVATTHSQRTALRS